MTDGDWISASDARRLLGVRAQTLYAYASRGLLRAMADPTDARRSLYRRVEVDEFAARKGRSRKLADVASAAIAWGEPVLESAITTVREGRFTYRGIDVVTLSERATLEETARLLTGFPDWAPRHRRRPEWVQPNWEERPPFCSTSSPMPQRARRCRVRFTSGWHGPGAASRTGVPPT